MEELRSGSPTTEGRPNAGYGSLMWRGPRSFLNVDVLTSEGNGAEEAMGKTARWLAFIGKHDGHDKKTTLIFVYSNDNPRHPTKWFVRNDPFAIVRPSFMFDEEYRLEPGNTFDLHYHVSVVCTRLTQRQIERYV